MGRWFRFYTALGNVKRLTRKEPRQPMTVPRSRLNFHFGRENFIVGSAFPDNISG